MGGLRVGSSGARFSLGPGSPLWERAGPELRLASQTVIPEGLGSGDDLGSHTPHPRFPMSSNMRARGCLSLTTDVSQQNWSRTDSWPWSSSVPGLPLPVSRREISWMRGGAVPVTRPLFALVRVTSSRVICFQGSGHLRLILSPEAPLRAHRSASYMH